MEDKDFAASEEGAAADATTPSAEEASFAAEESAATAAPPEVTGEEAATPPLRWQFGAQPPAAEEKKPRGERGRFFGVFGAVVCVTLALLVALLFVGDAGIKIFRTVTNERTIFVREEGTDGKLLTPEEAAAVVRASTVTVSVRRTDAQGIGSGFIYTADGYICTNYHVVESALEVQVVLPGGEAVDATVVGGDAAADIAVLKINKTGLTPVKLGKSATLLVGEDVVAVGTPYSLEYSGTATFGKISYTNRLLSIEDSSGNVTKKMTVIQTDTPVNNGNSGGPLANMYGEIVGIVVMKLSVANGNIFDAIGFALPIDGARMIIDEIIEDGSFDGENPIAVGRSLLGVTGRGLPGNYWYSDPTAETYEQSATEQSGWVYMPCDGVYVTAVNGTGVVGKLRTGDIITKINGLRMYTIYDVIGEVNRHQAGETVRVTYLRPDSSGHTEHTVEITLYEG